MHSNRIAQNNSMLLKYSVVHVPSVINLITLSFLHFGLAGLLDGWLYTVKLGNKERFDKEQIGIKEPFPVTNLPSTS